MTNIELPKLEYHDGREMDFKPLNFDSEDQLIGLLQEAKTVVVHLEPGDATRYELVIIPQWIFYTKKPGLNYVDAMDSVYVTSLNLDIKPSYINLSNGIGPWLIESENAWTRILVSTYLKRLAQLLRY